MPSQPPSEKLDSVITRGVTTPRDQKVLESLGRDKELFRHSPENASQVATAIRDRARRLNATAIQSINDKINWAISVEEGKSLLLGLGTGVVFGVVVGFVFGPEIAKQAAEKAASFVANSTSSAPEIIRWIINNPALTPIAQTIGNVAATGTDMLVGVVTGLGTAYLRERLETKLLKHDY